MTTKRMEQLGIFVTEHITNHFSGPTEQAAKLFGFLTLEQKVEVFEYATGVPIMKHPLFVERFGPFVEKFPEKRNDSVLSMERDPARNVR